MRLHPYAGSVAVCLILCFTLSCRKDGPIAPATDTPLNLPAGNAAITASANRFAIDIFQQVLQTGQAGTNILVSPLSIDLALDMAYNGAAGTTAGAMAKALQLNGAPLGELNSVNQALLQQLPKEDSRVQLSLANSIWYRQTGPQPATAFIDSVTENYLGTAQALDFSNPSSVNTINNWVAKNTNNKIPAIIQDLDAADIMVLVNAIYFNGAWMNAFKTSATANAPFYLAGGGTVSVPFMNEKADIRMSQTSTLTVAELPYGTGQAFDMYLLIPADETRPVNEFASSLNAATLDTAMANLDSVNVQLTIPKWEYGFSVQNLTPQLAQLGMGIAFSDSADFSNMYPTAQAHISQVIHKAYIQVSEQGTQAAAATAVVVGTSALPPAPVIRADHPFVYLIVEKQTGLILFMGIVSDPSKH